MKHRRKKIELRGSQKVLANGRPRPKRAARLVEQHLSMLGLTRRVQRTIGDDQLVGRLFPLTSRAVESVRFASPRSPEKYLLIEEMRGAPDANGWISEFHQVRAPFWIRKRKLGALRLVEEALDAMDCHRLEQS
jgi:hypothetical protein